MRLPPARHVMSGQANAIIIITTIITKQSYLKMFNPGKDVLHGSWHDASHHTGAGAGHGVRLPAARLAVAEQTHLFFTLKHASKRRASKQASKEGKKHAREPGNQSAGKRNQLQWWYST